MVVGRKNYASSIIQLSHHEVCYETITLRFVTTLWLQVQYEEELINNGTLMTT